MIMKKNAVHKRIIILSSCDDYWEACYVDGKCIAQAHHLGEGQGKLSFIKGVAEKYNVSLDDIDEWDAAPIDEDEAADCGAFPDMLNELKGEY